MTRTIIAVLITSFAASTAAIAQDAADTEQTPRQMMRELRQEIRADGVDQARFAEIITARTQARFERLDANGDGMISPEEFSANVENRIERQFARMDSNDDGMLTSDDRPMRGRRAAPAEQPAE